MILSAEEINDGFPAGRIRHIRSKPAERFHPEGGRYWVLTLEFTVEPESDEPIIIDRAVKP